MMLLLAKDLVQNIHNDFSYHIILFSFTLEESHNLSWLSWFWKIWIVQTNENVKYLSIWFYIMFSHDFDQVIHPRKLNNRYHRRNVVFPFHPIRCHKISACSITDSVHFDHLLDEESICQTSPLKNVYFYFFVIIRYYDNKIYVNIAFLIKLMIYLYRHGFVVS